MKNLWLPLFSLANFLAMGIFMNAHATDEKPEADLPVLLAFQYREGKPIAVEVANPSSQSRELVSNLPQVMETLFAGFPTQGSLQLKDARGGIVTLEGQNPDGWWYPSVLSSSVDPKNQMLGKTSTLKFSAGEKKSYSFEVQKILAASKANLGDHKETAIKQYRLRILFTIEHSNGGKLSHYLVSEWISYKPQK